MELRDCIREIVEEYVWNDPDGMRPTKSIDECTDRILSLPEIKEALEFKRRDDIMCELARGAQQAWRCEKPDGRIG